MKATMPSISLEAIAKKIDPDAWAEIPPPSRQRLEIELAKAHELIAALRDEIEWLSAGQGEPLKNPVLRQRAGREFIDDTEDQSQRRERALRTAREIMDACKRTLGTGNTLVIIRGHDKTRYYRRRGAI